MEHGRTRSRAEEDEGGWCGLDANYFDWRKSVSCFPLTMNSFRKSPSISFTKHSSEPSEFLALGKPHSFSRVKFLPNSIFTFDNLYLQYDEVIIIVIAM